MPETLGLEKMEHHRLGRRKSSSSSSSGPRNSPVHPASAVLVPNHNFVKMENPSSPTKSIAWSKCGGGGGKGRNSNFRWHIQIFLLLGLMCHPSNSDFNVILPEICGGTSMMQQESSINVTWVRDMVHLGLRDEQLALTILGPEEICDGSNGLIKFISLAKENPKGEIIASLEPHLCPTAATFRFTQGKQFFSWTCSKVPGVMSIKPSISDVILAINNFANYYHWHKFAFTKFQNDKSPFCDDVATQLQVEASGHLNNHSVLILSKYEDLSLPYFTPLTEKVQVLFLCTSYGYGYTHTLAKKTDHLGNKYFGRSSRSFTSSDKPLHGNLPLVLLPEWPLPLEVYNPESPTLALTARFRPFTEEFHFYHHESEPSSHKIMESLLARLILKSVKEALEIGKFSEEDEDALIAKEGGNEQRVSSNSASRGHGNEAGLDGMEHDDDDARSDKSPIEYEVLQSYVTSFQFSVLQYEKGRWHQVVTFADTDKEPRSNGKRHHGATPSSIHHNPYFRNVASHNPNAGESEDDDGRSSTLTWTQLIGAMLLTAIIVAAIIGASLYARERIHNQVYIPTTSSQKKNWSGRQRNIGPYKIILQRGDLCFNSFWGENNKKMLTSLPTAQSTATEDGTLTLEGDESKHPNDSKPDLIKGSFGPRKQIGVSQMKNDSIVLSENQARYKGDLVHLRKLAEPTDSFQVKPKAMTVLETIHGLRHENVNALIGCLTEGIPALVWEYCSRGSLHDIIKRQDIKLDWAFKLSLLTDLVRGMRYLHSSLVRVHGFLTSYNCVIDARWVLKITDYGILSFCHTQGLTLPQRSPKELLWTAPELLRDEGLRRHGTQPGDVYSFAIIMQEVLVRGEPYCMLTLSPEEILEKVKNPPPLIRPSVSKNLAQPEAINIMRQCWAETADMRPDFTVIHDLFKTLNHGRKANIVDTMFQMLEKYSNNLEELIRERTEQLDLEKKKTEQLLNRMLPSTVAEKLKLGLPVDPEEFSEVTIYFSDIVGFTTISAYSTPFEVVDLLNDLYTCFDATINDYNVYKVETIGDAYMCVSGAPVRFENHADQIATMALDLLHESGKFRIRHLPYTPLRVRIGLHTGPCCAGVVGLTMPRYCLFGDTVNTASRMESTGAPWRIHISENTKQKLESIGGFKIEFRGITDIKGKGKMTTYWLKGKEGFDKELPVPPDPKESHGLDERLIIYGRTGKYPNEEEVSRAVIFRERRSSSHEITSQGRLDPMGKPSGAGYTLIHGESMRCLSPSEQVAHQLLNGRPATRGLRRQFSLDQGTSYCVTPVTPLIRKMPSSDEAYAIGAGEHFVTITPAAQEKNSSSSSAAVSETVHLHQAKSLDSATPSTSRTIFHKNDNNENNQNKLQHMNNNPTSPSPSTSTPNASPNNKMSRLSPRSIKPFIKSSSLPVVDESTEQQGTSAEPK